MSNEPTKGDTLADDSRLLDLYRALRNAIRECDVSDHEIREELHAIDLAEQNAGFPPHQKVLALCEEIERELNPSCWPPDSRLRQVGDHFLTRFRALAGEVDGNVHDVNMPIGFDSACIGIDGEPTPEVVDVLKDEPPHRDLDTIDQPEAELSL